MSTILVTGAANGIGRATAIAAARVYDVVYIMDIDVEHGFQTAIDINDSAGRAIFLEADVANSCQLDKMFAWITEYGGIDAAVNCAGILGAKDWVKDYHECDWRQVLDVNLTGTFLCMQRELAAGVSNIVNVSSASALIVTGYPICGYAVSKVGMNMLTQIAAAENFNQCIVAICPTGQDTAMNRELTGEYYDDEGQALRLAYLGELIVRLTELNMSWSGTVAHQDEWSFRLGDVKA